MINIVELRNQCKSILKDDAGFAAFSFGLLGENLNYYTGTNEDRSKEILPAIVFLQEVAKDEEGERIGYIVSFNIQIIGEQNPEPDGEGDDTFPAEKIVGDLVVAAEKVLRRKISCIDVGGETDFFVSDSSMAVAPLEDAMIDKSNGNQNHSDIGSGYLAAVELVVAQIKHLGV